MKDFIKLVENIERLKEAKKDKILNIATLFSGMGAPEIALDKLGVKYQVVLASDIDPEAEAVYRQLHGNKLSKTHDSFIPNVYDVLDNFDSDTDIDLLIAGFSCQAFSKQGKGYGVYSRQVIPIGTNNHFVVHLKKHLKDINGDEAVTVNNDKSDPLPEGLPENTIVKISPDSDGKLALQTLKIARELKPKVIILENVSAFGRADIPRSFIKEAKTINVQKSILGQSGIADTSEGGYLRLLGKIFNDIGYSFYPMYLDPTSYTDSIARRPRIYIVGIRNDVEVGINPNKLEGFTDKMASNFGLNISKSTEDYNKLLEKGLDYIMSSKYSQGFMSNDPKELVKNLASRFGVDKLVSTTNYIFDKLISDGIINFNNFNLKRFKNNSDIIDPVFNDSKIIKALSKGYDSNKPVIIDVSNKNDTLDYLSNIIANNISAYFDKEYGYFTYEEPQGRLNLYGPNTNRSDSSSEVSYKKNLRNSSNNNLSKQEDNSTSDQFQFDFMNDDSLEEIAEEIIHNKNNLLTETSSNKVNDELIKEIKSVIVKKLLILFLNKLIKKKSLNYIPTIMKKSELPKTVGRSGNANYFILRNKAGEFSWGYLHPAILMRLMGFYMNNSEGDDELYQKIAKTKLKDGSTISLNGIIRRIGNSMSVKVLEKLFKALINMKAL